MVKTIIAVSGPSRKRSLGVEIGDEHLTSHGGLSVLEAYLDRLSLRQHLDSRFSHLDGTTYSAADVLSLLLASKIMGDDRMRDLRRFRRDEAVKVILGLPRVPHPTTASRLLERMSAGDLFSMECLWAEILRERLLAGRKSVVVDVDSTPLLQWGRQEGIAKGYCPKRRGGKTYNVNLAFDAKTGLPLHQMLRPGNRNSLGPREEFRWFLEFLFTLVLPHVPHVIFRADSGYFAGYVFDALEAEGARYVVSARGEIFPGLEPDAVTWTKPRRGIQYGEFRYRKKGWKEARRFVIKRDHHRESQLRIDGLWDTDVVIVTNQKGSPKRVVQFYNARGTAEQYIAEGKQSFAFEKFPSRRFLVNKIDFALKTMAMGFLIGFREEMLPDSLKRHRPGTVRVLFVNVAAKLVRTGRRMFLRLTKAVRHREAWEQIFVRLGRAPPKPIFAN